MPYKSYGCKVCGKQAPTRLREHGTEAERWDWLRKHYMTDHPHKWKEWQKKSAQTKSKK